MMILIELTRRQIKKIYKEYMVNDFPADELKPLIIILRARRKGKYICLGLEKNEEIVGYAFFVKLNNDYLFDYLAVREEDRNKNYGSIFIELLKERFKDADSVIGEVENPDYARDEDERDLRSRRINFYLRNGLVDTGIRAKTFGVEFLILEIDLGKSHSDDEIKELYQYEYRSILTEKLYRNNIVVY